MIWYPYQQMKTMGAPYEIIDASGVYLYTREQKLIDSVSSWWSVIHGYKHPELNEAITAQVGRFSHVMLGGLTHGWSSSCPAIWTTASSPTRGAWRWRSP